MFNTHNIIEVIFQDGGHKQKPPYWYVCFNNVLGIFNRAKKTDNINRVSPEQSARKLVSNKKKTGQGPTHPSFFWYDND